MTLKGGPNDREALRVVLRFLHHGEDVAMDVLVTQRAEMMTLQVRYRMSVCWRCSGW